MSGPKITKETVCRRCISKAGLNSDRCIECKDYSAFACGRYSIRNFEGLSAKGRLAFILSELDAAAQEE